MVSFFMLVGGCRVWFLMCTPYCTLDGWTFGLRIIGMLLALSAPCVFPLRFYTSLPRTYNWLFSLMSTNSFGLRPPSVMADSHLRKLSLQLVSIVLSWCTTIVHSFLELAEEDYFGHWSSLKKTGFGVHTSSILVTWQPSTAAPEARWTLCWAGWLS